MTLPRAFYFVVAVSLISACSSDPVSSGDTQTQQDLTQDQQVAPDVNPDVGQDLIEDTTPPKDESPEDTAAPDTQTPDLSTQDTEPVPDVFDTGVSPHGYNTTCLTGADCAQYGLSCFRYGPQDVNPICSRLCETNMDCPPNLVCDYKYGYETPQKICREAMFCSECQDDSQCELPNMKCVTYGSGGSFCTESCQPGILSCPGGGVCQFVDSTQDWRCVPTYGACKGDGGACSPCRVEEDCQTPTWHCAESYYTKERFCVKECNSGTDCPNGHQCFDVGGDVGICYLTYLGEYVPTCHIQTQEFCHECRGDFECTEGNICYIGPGGTGFYCVPKCTSSAGCPEGTECKGSFSLETGMLSGQFGCKLLDEKNCLELIQQSTPE